VVVEEAVGIDPAVVGEVIDEASMWTDGGGGHRGAGGRVTWTRRRSGRRSARHRRGPDGNRGGGRRGTGVDLTTVEASRRPRSGHTGGGEMIPSGLGFMWQPCN
jgi:hypothetical protein